MPEATRARLRVLGRPARRNRALNPYNARIVDHLPEHGVDVSEYRWPLAFVSAFDVVHVHWPESSFNHGLLGARATTESLLLALRAQRARGARVMWTVHNLRAHERRYVEAEEAFWRRYLPLVDGVITLGRSSWTLALEARPELKDRPHFVIPHPHYRGEYPDTLSRSEARRQLNLPPEAPVVVAFGQVKAYKNLPALISTCREMDEVHLVIAGQPRDAEIRDQIKKAGAGFERLQTHLHYVEAERAQVFLRAADLVALPYRAILNSGSALLALSFDRPVWLPTSSLADELERQMPEGWVHSGMLGPSALEAALDASRTLPERTEGDHLSSFEPSEVAAAHAAAYRALMIQKKTYRLLRTVDPERP